MMAARKRVKIIKRAERHGPQTVLSEKGRPAARNSGEMAKPDAATVVTGWVRELRRRKVEEATHGFESLFGKAPTSSL